MAKTNKASKDPVVHQPTLFEKITDQAAHISHEIAVGTGHLLEVAADKFSAVKEKIIHKIGAPAPAKKTGKAVVKKPAAKKKAAPKVKTVVAVVKKKAASKAKPPLKKTAKKKVAPKKATKKILRRK